MGNRSLPNSRLKLFIGCATAEFFSFIFKPIINYVIFDTLTKRGIFNLPIACVSTLSRLINQKNSPLPYFPLQDHAILPLSHLPSHKPHQSIATLPHLPPHKPRRSTTALPYLPAHKPRHKTTAYDWALPLNPLKRHVYSCIATKHSSLTFHTNTNHLLSAASNSREGERERDRGRERE